MSYVALILSVVSLIVTTVWAVYTWRRAGEVLKLKGDLRPRFAGHVIGKRQRRAGAVVGLVTITAENHGRTPATIHRLWLASKSRKQRSTVAFANGSAPLPVVVNARDRVTWFVKAEDLGVLAKRYGNPVVVRPLIEWGPGRRTHGRVLRIALPEKFLPGNAARFKPSIAYRLLAPRRWASPDAEIEFTAQPVTVIQGPPNG